MSSTKDKLIALGKNLYNLAFKPTETKEGIIKKIIQTAEKPAPAKKAAKPVAKKAKEVAAKPAKKTAPAAKAAEKKAKPAGAAKRLVIISSPAPAKSAAKKPVVTKAAPQKPEAKKPEAVKPPVEKAMAKSPVTTKALETKKPAPVAVQRKRTESAALNLASYQNRPSPTGEENVEKSKYMVANIQEHMEFASLPEKYEDNRIILFVRDPFWVFTSWDLHGHKPTETARTHGINLSEFNTALRVYDVTDVNFNGTNAHKHFDLDVGHIKGTYYINVPEDDRNYIVDVGLKNLRGEFYMMARSNMVGVPRNGASTRMDEEWMIADEDFWRMYALSGGFQARQGAASMELTEMMRQRLSGESSSGAISSFGSERAPKARDQFWYRLDCELIVYGATEADANVTMMGKKVHLRSDGTFTARFALPDGIQVIDTKAVSANGKFEKTITPTVSRGTATFQNREFFEETEQ